MAPEKVEFVPRDLSPQRGVEVIEWSLFRFSTRFIHVAGVTFIVKVRSGHVSRVILFPIRVGVLQSVSSTQRRHSLPLFFAYWGGPR